MTINKDKSTCTVAVKEGLLHRAMTSTLSGLVLIDSNNRTVMDLEHAYIHWKGLPKITEREAARYMWIWTHEKVPGLCQY